ncbi:MAG: hypothetical protein JWQ95_4914 [Sphaerisporangium sp.]|nr:hypothetical protein [Sphaerisporangium sp.]
MLRIESTVVTPDPPFAGARLKATIEATAQEEILDGAFLDVTVKGGLTGLKQVRYDLFKKLSGDRSDGWSLSLDAGSGGEPIKRGKVGLTFAWDLPHQLPPDKFGIKVSGFNADGASLAALDFKFDFEPR